MRVYPYYLLSPTAILGGEDPVGLFYRWVNALGELRSGIRWSAGGRARQEPGPGAAGLEVPAHTMRSEEICVLCPEHPERLEGCREPGLGIQGSSGPTLHPSLTGPHPRQFPWRQGQAGVGPVCRELVRPLPHILGLHWLTPSPHPPWPLPKPGATPVPLMEQMKFPQFCGLQGPDCSPLLTLYPLLLVPQGLRPRPTPGTPRSLLQAPDPGMKAGLEGRA